MIERPMLLSAVCCGLAVIISVRFPVTLIFITLAVILIMTVLIIKNIKPQYIFVGIIVLVTVVSIVTSLSRIDKLNALDNTYCKCEFTVENITYENNSFHFAEVRINKSDVLEKGTKLSVSFNGDLQLGDIAEARLILEKIDGKYRLQNYSKGLFLSANVDEYKITDKKNFLFKNIGIVRKYITKTVFGYLGFEEASTLVALLFGERGYFTNEFYNNVKAAGVSHVMVVSGMHLTIFVGIFTSAFKKLFYNRYICAVLQILAVFIMASLCGFTMSILRAGVMYIVMSLGLILKRRSESANSLGAAVSFILAASPFAVFNVAFQLSVLSTFGILSVALPITRYLKRRQIIKNKYIKWIFENLIISVSATLLTLPVAINTFGFVSSVGVITTLIITLPITFCICVSVIALTSNLIFESLAEIIFIPCGYAMEFTNFVINKMASLPFAVVYTDKIWVYITIGIIILIFCVLLACKMRLDMIKLNGIREKIIKEGGGKLKWR